MAVCGAESAGISLLDHIDGERFFWPAIAGRWAPYQGGGMPRSASPCGIVIARNRSLIFHDVERQFPAAAAAVPRIEEILLAPFDVDGQPVGTVWALDHTGAKQFDREDRRILENLAHFAGAAFKLTSAAREAVDAKAQLAFLNEELSHRLKNMLAMVMAIATQTLRDVPDRDAVNALKARLQSLASAHDLLVDQAWEAAPMDIIVLIAAEK